MKKLSCALSALLICGLTFAADLKVVGTINQTIYVQPAPSSRLPAFYAAPPVKHIALLKIQLSENAQKTIKQRAEKFSFSSLTHQRDGVSSQMEQVQLGMNNVPVLNQGIHGTCVTFAITAAIDAALGKGDYVSQLCLLQLGRYLENHAYSPSGWDGAWGFEVLSHMSTFGLVNKENQQKIGCGGETIYPMFGPVPTSEISLIDYHKMSEPLIWEKIIWTPLLGGMIEIDTGGNILNKIKKSLHAGNRVVLGSLLMDLDLGTAGAVGMHKAYQDTWVLTPTILEDIQKGGLEDEVAGHEMVITGFDDKAIAIDEQGGQHKGLLTLRNSWGEYMGDKGDFYMSYDYFNALAYEAHRISKVD